MRKRCRLAARYAKWAGLERNEPRWGWIWSITLHAVVLIGAVLWTAAILGAFVHCVG